MYNWFADYLSGRYQRVVIDGTVSNWARVTSGVPQGTILGPDILPDEKMASLYADCTRICNSLRWSRDNKLEFKGADNHKEKISVDLCLRIELDCIIAYCIEKEKDLGVCVNGNLSWNDRIYTITGNANEMLRLDKNLCLIRA